MQRQPEPVLSVADLSVGFPHGGVEGLRGATLDVAAGETVVLLGESGSGKSLLGATVAGLLPDSALRGGAVRIDGRDVLHLGESALEQIRGRVVGYVPQSAGLSLNPVRTALSQVEEVYTRVHGQSRGEGRQAALALLAELGLSAEAVARYPHQLSGGMRQRVLVAIGLASRPRVLIADEPTKGLDERLRSEAVRLFKTVRDARPDLALLIITHDLEVAEALADRIAVLYAGMVVEEMRAERFFRAPRHPYARRLLDASPRRGLVPIPGAPPEPGAVIPGCPFAARCASVASVCHDVRPPRIEDADDRVFCHYPAPV